MQIVTLYGLIGDHKFDVVESKVSCICKNLEQEGK